MTKSLITSLLLSVLMVSSAVISKAVTPTIKLADQSEKILLADIVPTSFGDWHIDPDLLPLQVNPEIEARLNKIYNQTLLRTYVNRAGQHVMLAIAYGGDQSDYTAVH